MKTLLTLIAIIITFSSCSKLEELTPEHYDIPQHSEVHVYYDSAVYNISVNGMFVQGGNTHKQGVDVYRIDSLSNINFHILQGKRTSVTVRHPTYKHEYGYVRNIRNGLVSPF